MLWFFISPHTHKPKTISTREFFFWFKKNGELFRFSCNVQLLKRTQELTLKLYGFTCFPLGVSDIPRGKTWMEGEKKLSLCSSLPSTLPRLYLQSSVRSQWGTARCYLKQESKEMGMWKEKRTFKTAATHENWEVRWKYGLVLDAVTSRRHIRMNWIINRALNLATLN